MLKSGMYYGLMDLWKRTKKTNSIKIRTKNGDWYMGDFRYFDIGKEAVVIHSVKKLKSATNVETVWEDTETPQGFYYNDVKCWSDEL